MMNLPEIGKAERVDMMARVVCQVEHADRAGFRARDRGNHFRSWRKNPPAGATSSIAHSDIRDPEVITHDSVQRGKSPARFLSG